MSSSAPKLEVPTGLVQILRQTEEFVLTNHFLTTYWLLIVKLSEWTLFYILGYFGVGYGWILFMATVYYSRWFEVDVSSTLTTIPKWMNQKSEKEVLSETLTSFPAWVAFPDFSRVDWINDIIKKIWPNVGAYATEFVKDFIEPHLNGILERMFLDQLSKFQIKKVELGSIPAHVGGIKVYSRNISRDEIILDLDVSYAGDARVLFTLQGISAEINTIRFRGVARVTLKPLLDAFPFIGGFDIFFLSMPTLEYGLGGVVAGGELPIIRSVVKNIVEGEIKSRFVWPNRLYIALPIDATTRDQYRHFVLPKPTGVLRIDVIRGQHLIAKDDHFMGSGKSDPYVIVSVGKKVFNFRDRYLAKTVDPEWNYSIPPLVLEEYSGQMVHFEVFDHDKTNDDDFLGSVSIRMESIVEHGNSWDTIFTLEKVKHGEIFVRFQWIPIIQDSDIITDDSKSDPCSSYAVSVYVDHCTNLGTEKTSHSLFPKCSISLGHDSVKVSAITNKTANPVFEEGFLFLSKQPFTESLKIKVSDQKSNDILGTTSISIAKILNYPRHEFYDAKFRLDGAANPEAEIVLSAKLFKLSTTKKSSKAL